jgi:ATP-dependent Clp protease ATP-binding subunit ClpC
MFERFTDRARKVMQLANQEAQRFNHEYIGTEHVLLGLVKEGSGVAANVLKNLEIDLRKIRSGGREDRQTGPTQVVMGSCPTPPGQEGDRVLDRGGPEPQPQLLGPNTCCSASARARGGRGPGADEPALSSKTSARKFSTCWAQILTTGAASGRGPASGSSKSRQDPALDSFGRDLTDLARQTSWTSSAANEIERVVQILSPTHQEQPRLSARPASARPPSSRGLAQLIIDGNVPELLRDRRFVVLDLAMMVAGTKYRGQFEERIKAGHERGPPRQERRSCSSTSCTPSSGPGGREGRSTPRTCLKPALARGEIQCIGATTLDEYRKYIEKDAPSPAGSRRSSSTRPARPRRSRSSRACATATRRTTASRSPTRR